LAANEREPRAELAEGVDDALNKPVFQMSLRGVYINREELGVIELLE
jgi:hypothetical protein